MNKAAEKDAARSPRAAAQPLKKFTPGDFEKNAERALKSIGKNIQKARVEIYGLGQVEMAEVLGISHVTLRKIERGEGGQSIHLMMVLAAMRRHNPVVMAANPSNSELLVSADQPQSMGLQAPAGLPRPNAVPAPVAAPVAASAPHPADLLMKGIPLRRPR